jgi:hypothetical protein
MKHIRKGFLEHAPCSFNIAKDAPSLWPFSNPTTIRFFPVEKFFNK